jgi:tetratricopeptide (TPR) repeat protein
VRRDVSVNAIEETLFRVRESGLRQTILRAGAALLVALASLLLFLVMPLFPRELMVFVALGLGALAFKTPTLALALMVLFALPGYMYQLSSALPAGVQVPVAMIAVMSVGLLLMAVLAGEMGGVLGVASGAIAAMLMLTPCGFLALPLIVATVLFRTRRASVRVGSAILTFVILYYPVLAVSAGTAPGNPVPILQTVSLHTAAPVSVLSFEEISAKVGGIFGTDNSRDALPYLQSLTEYWPLSPEQRLLPAGVLLALQAIAAITVVAAMLSLFRWLKKREVGGVRLEYAAPVLSMLAAMLAFAFLSGLLAEPLNYIGPTNPIYIAAGGVVVGGGGSLVEVWLKRRNTVVELREQLTEKATVVRSETDLLKNKIEEMKVLCRRMDTSAEDTLLQRCEQELTFTEQGVADMSSTDLAEKVMLFEELLDKLGATIQGSNARLYQYYDEDRQRYSDTLTLAKGYGFSLGECLESLDFSVLTSMEYSEVLKLQGRLNESYRASARLLAEGIDELEARLCTEVDPDFGRSGIHIARDYFARERYSEALEEFLRELGDIEYVLAKTVAGLDKDIFSVLGSLKTIVTDVLVPTAGSMGDATSVSYYHEALSTIDRLSSLPGDAARLPDLMRIVSAVRELGDLVARLCSRLGERIVLLETGILNRAPHGYRWHHNLEVFESVTEISRTINGSPSLLGMRDRVSLIKSVPVIVDSAAHTVRDYSIVHELLINYANIEYLIDEKLQDEGVVNTTDLPVGRKYAGEYLEIYCLKHPTGVYIERDLGTLSKLSPAPVT